MIASVQFLRAEVGGIGLNTLKALTHQRRIVPGMQQRLVQHIGMYAVGHIAQWTGGSFLFDGIDGVMNESTVYQASVTTYHEADDVRQSCCSHGIGHSDGFCQLRHDAGKQIVRPRLCQRADCREMKLHGFFYRQIVAAVVRIAAASGQSADLYGSGSFVTEAGEKGHSIRQYIFMPVIGRGYLLDVRSAGGSHQHQWQAELSGYLQVLPVDGCQNLTMGAS